MNIPNDSLCRHHRTHSVKCVFIIHEDMLDEAWNSTYSLSAKLKAIWNFPIQVVIFSVVIFFFVCSFIHSLIWRYLIFSRILAGYIVGASHMREPQQLWDDSSRWHIPIKSILNCVYVPISAFVVSFYARLLPYALASKVSWNRQIHIHTHSL